MSFDLCGSFRYLAADTFRIIQDARRMRFQLKEESFTDFNLFRLKLYHSDEILIKTFNRIEESVVGADWEWWLSDAAGRWIGFRVQAKIIALNADEFTHLHYQPPKCIAQCEKLILQATSNPMYPCIPLYCLYLTTPHDIAPGTPDIFLHGCSLLSAYRVRQLRATRETALTSLWPDLKPWHRLVCFDNGNNIIDHVDRLTRSYFLPQRDRNRRQLWINEPPPYVLDVIETGDGKASLDNKPIDLAGVMIIQSTERRF
jgi:hypothetical protein